MDACRFLLLGLGNLVTDDFRYSTPTHTVLQAGCVCKQFHCFLPQRSLQQYLELKGTMEQVEGRNVPAHRS